MLALIVGIIALVSLLYFNKFSENYFHKRQQVTYEINTIETSEKSLDYEVLRSGFFLYLNQDSIIQKIATVEKITPRIAQCLEMSLSMSNCAASPSDAL